MTEHLKKWWATHVSWIALAVTFLSPSVLQWVSAHPAYAATIGAGWSIITNLVKSPITPAAPSN